MTQRLILAKGPITDLSGLVEFRYQLFFFPFESRCRVLNKDFVWCTMPFVFSFFVFFFSFKSKQGIVNGLFLFHFRVETAILFVNKIYAPQQNVSLLEDYLFI